MSLHLFRQSPLLLTGLLSPILALLTVSLPAGAQLSPSLEVSLTFPKTQDRGAPNRTTGAGARNDKCVAPEEIPLTAFMPRNNVGTTISSNPDIFVYVPPTKARTAELLIIDPEKEEEVYSETLTLSNTSGVIQLTLPATVNLEVGKEYRWGFSLICDPQRRDSDISVMGVLYRNSMTPDMERKLTQANSSLDKARIYAEEGIWTEMVSILAPLQQSYPQEWREVLQSVELQQMAEVPVHLSNSSQHTRDFRNSQPSPTHTESPSTNQQPSCAFAFRGNSCNLRRRQPASETPPATVSPQPTQPQSPTPFF